MKISCQTDKDALLRVLLFRDVDRWELLEFDRLCDTLKEGYSGEGTAAFTEGLKSSFAKTNQIAVNDLERLSKYCHTGGAWAKCTIPGQRIGRFLLADYSLPRLVDAKNRRVAAYVDDMRAMVSHIIAAETAFKLDGVDDDEATTFPEGRAAYRWHKTYERNSAAVREAKSRARTAGKLHCWVCGFDFEKVYGVHGSGYIECHHTIPISEPIMNRKTAIEDLAMVCSNCHRMLHRRRPWLKMEQLKELVPQLH